MNEKRFTVRRDEKGAILIPNSILKDGEIIDEEEIVDLLNEQQATITSLEDENLYKNFKLKSVDDLKKLKDIFEICMILIDSAIADVDLELGYESVFQFERRIKKFNGD